MAGVLDQNRLCVSESSAGGGRAAGLLGKRTTGGLLTLVGLMALVAKPDTATVWRMVRTTVTAFSPPLTLVMVGASGFPAPGRQAGVRCGTKCSL